MVPASHPWANRPRRVLVVDDDEATRLEFVAALRDSGYEVIEAASVVQAMRLLLGASPDAVVLDLVLPDGHGIEVGRAMRSIVTTRRTCVVAVTASATSLALVDPASFGADTILVKPVPLELLLAAVSGCFDDGRTERVMTEPGDPDRRPEVA